MDRRQVFGAVAAGAVAVATGATGAEPGDSLRACHKWTARGWERCRMYELVPRDVVWIEEVGVFIVHEPPEKCPDGGWGIHAHWGIDPKTNKWVPAHQVG